VNLPFISLRRAVSRVMQTKNSGIQRKRDTIMSKIPKNNLVITILPFFLYGVIEFSERSFTSVQDDIVFKGFPLLCLYNTIPSVRKNGL